MSRFWPLRSPLHIYTDGSHKGKWGSWAFIIVRDQKIIHESFGRVRRTNSHRMEFQAAIEALSYLKSPTQVILHSDSKILIDCATSILDRPTVNADQLQQLDALILKHKISWKWVKAHAGHEFNERCDQLCIQARS